MVTNHDMEEEYDTIHDWALHVINDLFPPECDLDNWNVLTVDGENYAAVAYDGDYYIVGVNGFHRYDGEATPFAPESRDISSSYDLGRYEIRVNQWKHRDFSVLRDFIKDKQLRGYVYQGK